MLIALVASLLVTPRVQAQELNFLHTEGNQILDSHGRRVIVTGISWFGLETENYAPHGLWARSLESLLDQIVELGFNTIRLPFSSQLFDPGSQPNGINYDLNPDLQGATGLEIMDRIVAEAGQRGLRVILDRHRPDSHAQSELWYTAQYSEERWIADWVMLAQRYAAGDTVIGMDLHNEPRGQATWGSGDPATDWRLAAERAGDAILAVNPRLLIIVQGVERFQDEYYWWGGNLMGVREYPVRLNQPGQLVYSPHTYGPGVYPQAWFSDPSFPDNMPGIWDKHWGFVHKEGLAPVILGEFGGRSVEDDREGVWQRALVAYLRENEISYLYWTLNPNSGDTGGVLLDDWQSIDPGKQELLSGYQAPLIGAGPPGGSPPATSAPPAAATQALQPPATSTLVPTSTPAPSATAAPVSAAPVSRGGVSVRYHTSNTAERSSDAKPEFIIANRGAQPVRLEDLEIVYWFSDEPGRTYSFTCDWAQIGCEKISAEFEALAGGAYALHVRFRPGSGELPPGGESGEIKLRFNRLDWSEMSQSDDYSFSNPGNFIEWERVAAYAGGQLVWGAAPGAAPVESATVVTPPSTALTTPAATAVLGTSAATAEPSTPEAPASSRAQAASAPAWGLWAVITLLAFGVGFLLAWLLLVRRDR